MKALLKLVGLGVQGFNPTTLVLVFKKICAMAKPVAISIFDIRANETMSHSSSVKDAFVADSATKRHVAIGIAVEDKLARAVSLSNRQKILFFVWPFCQGDILHDERA